MTALRTVPGPGCHYGKVLPGRTGAALVGVIKNSAGSAAGGTPKDVHRDEINPASAYDAGGEELV